MWLGWLLACTGETPEGKADDTHDSGEVVGTDDTGEPPDTGEAPLPAWRGTWVAQIKDMDPASSAHCQDGGWYTDDVEAMRDALLETGQNTYAGYIDDGDDADCWFLNLEAMLEAVEPEDDLTVFGAVKTGRPASDYIDTLAALRERAAAHPELRGMLIDDFFFMPQTVYNPRRGLTQDDMAAMASTAHDGDAPEIELWTHIAGHAVGELLIPGVVLGASHCADGCTLFPAASGLAADEVWFELTAEAPEDDATFAALLRNELLYGDELLLRVSLDGVVVHEQVLGAEQAYTQRRVAASLPTVAGQQHTVRVSVQAHGAAVTDRIELSGFLLGEEWISVTDTGTSRDAGRGLADAGLMAEQTDSGHILPWIDGVLLHFWDDSAQHDIEVVRHLYRATCEHLAAADVRCVATMWGNEQWALELDLAQIGERLSAAAELTEGAVVFRYPLDMHGHVDGVPPDEGVYLEQTPLDPAYDLMGFWPGYTRGIPGWSHAWESTASCDGEHTLRWDDNDGITGRFRYGLQRNGETLVSVDVGDVSGAEERAVSLAAGDVLRIYFEETDSVGNVTVYMQAAVDPPEGCPALEWRHAAASDPQQASLYDCYTSWFRGLEHGPVCR